MFRACLIVAALFAVPLAAADKYEKAKGIAVYDEFPAKFVASLKANYVAQANELEARIKKAKSAVAKAKRSEKELAKDVVKELETELHNLKEINDPPYIGCTLWDTNLVSAGGNVVKNGAWNVGDIGTFDGRDIAVKQVTRSGEILATSGNYDGPGLFFLRGIDTEEIVSDTRLAVRGAFVVSGTATYETVGGAAKTVLVVQPFDWDAYREKYIEPKKAE